MTEWTTEMMYLTVVYRLAEVGDKIPANPAGTPYQHIDEELNMMFSDKYLEIKEGQYRVSEKGRELLTHLVAMFDATMRFNIFANVIHDEPLDEELTEDGIQVFNHVFDPRFSEDDGEDMRIAMMEYFVEAARREGKDLEGFDSRRIVFLQKLADGEFASQTDSFWKDMKNGEVFKTIERIVENAYHMEDLGEDEEESFEVASHIYAAGNFEDRKRTGPVCSKCDTPLALFEAEAQQEGKTLGECPNPECDAVFDGGNYGHGGDVEYECPNCGRDIYSGQSVCSGCGANVDFSLPSGTVTTEHETVTETVVEEDPYYEDFYGPPGYYYGYQPYGYYDPYYPHANALAFGVVCGAVLF